MFSIKKGFLKFIFFRLLALLFTLNIFPKFQRGFSDARFLLGQYDNLDGGMDDTASGIFSLNTFLIKYIFTSLLPNTISFATIILSLITSFIIWKTLKEFLLQRNSILLWIAIFFPSYGVYTMLPSKEAIFISISLIYISFEAKNIVYKPIKKWNEFSLLLQRFIYLSICLTLRGFASFPYLFLGLFVSLFPFISSFLIKYKNRKNNALILITLSVLITFFSIVILIPHDNPFLVGKITNFKLSFIATKQDTNLTRKFLSDKNPFEIINFIQLPYLSLFPTLKELMLSPKLILYVIESSAYVAIYIFAWSKVINTSLLNSRKIKFIQYLFISVTISYFLIYSIIGSYNLGSSLRFRQNFSNIGHILPLVIFYNCKIKKHIILSKSFK